MPAVEQRRDRLAGDPIALVLEPVDLDGVARDVLEAAQPRDRLGDLRRCLLEHPRQADRLVHRRLDLVQAEVVGDLLGVVDDVVERRGEREDVLAVDRRDERVVEAIDDVVGDPVALVLAVEDLVREVLARPGSLVEHRVQQIGGAHHVLPGLLEQLEVDPISGRTLESSLRDQRAMPPDANAGGVARHVELLHEPRELVVVDRVRVLGRRERAQRGPRPRTRRRRPPSAP